MEMPITDTIIKCLDPHVGFDYGCSLAQNFAKCLPFLSRGNFGVPWRPCSHQNWKKSSQHVKYFRTPDRQFCTSNFTFQDGWSGRQTPLSLSPASLNTHMWLVDWARKAAYENTCQDVRLAECKYTNTRHVGRGLLTELGVTHTHTPHENENAPSSDQCRCGR